MFVGQSKNLEIFRKLKESNSIPKLSIIVGDPLSGKTSLIYEFCKIIDEKIEPILYRPTKGKNAISVDELRSMLDIIKNSDTSNINCYIIEKFESMSKEGQNIVLKIFEEPPKNTYFFIEVSYIDLLLETIKSRGNIFSMSPYSKQELLEYNKNASDIIDFVSTPEEINYWTTRDAVKKINLFRELGKSLYESLLKNKDIITINQFLSNITFDREDHSSFYYNDLMRELNKNILLNYKWTSENQKFAYLSVYDKVNKENRVAGIRKEDLVKRYILDCYSVLKV